MMPVQDIHVNMPLIGKNARALNQKKTKKLVISKLLKAFNVFNTNSTMSSFKLIEKCYFDSEMKIFEVFLITKYNPSLNKQFSKLVLHFY